MWMETFYWALTTSKVSHTSHPLIIPVYGEGVLLSPKSLPWPSRPMWVDTLPSTLPLATLSFPPLQPQGLCQCGALILKPLSPQFPWLSLLHPFHITSSKKPSWATHLPLLSVPLSTGFVFLYCTYYHLKYYMCSLIFFSPLLKAPLEAGIFSFPPISPEQYLPGL